MTTLEQPLSLSIPQDSGLEIESMTSLASAFQPFFETAEVWRQKALACKVTDETDTRGMKFARESRLALREQRIGVENTRKRLKEDSLRKGKVIDGIANVFKGTVEPIEEYLMEQEQFAERAEQKRKDAKFAERSEMLFAIESPAPSNLRDMSDEEFTRLYQDTKDLIQMRKDREAAAEAERKRIEIEEAQARIAKAEAERVERERITAENERLRKEAAEREKLAAIEREKAAQAAREAAAKAEAERLKAEAVAKIEREKLEAIAKVEREKAAKLQAEIEAKEKAEKEKARKEAAAAKAAAAAPEREKLRAFITQIDALAVPDCEIKAKIIASIERLKSGINEHIEAMGGEA